MRKVLLVVGGSSGIGVAFIRRCCFRYDTVVATYNRNRGALERLCLDFGKKITAYQLNLLEDSEVEEFKRFLCRRELIPSYVLYLPALQSKMVRASEVNGQTLRDELQVSVVSFINLMRVILPGMSEKQFGRVCCLLSSVTEKAVAFRSPYVVSKFALLGAVKALATEYAEKRITINAVSPSMINTKFVVDPTGFIKKKNIAVQPLKRLASEDDVVRALAFYLEDENEYITGENMLIAGGGIIS